MTFDEFKKISKATSQDHFLTNPKLYGIWMRASFEMIPKLIAVVEAAQTLMTCKDYPRIIAVDKALRKALAELEKP